MRKKMGLPVALFELQRDALGNDKIHKAVAVLSGTAGDALGEFRSSLPSVWLTSET
jgi:hypothetical protein